MMTVILIAEAIQRLLQRFFRQARSWYGTLTGQLRSLTVSVNAVERRLDEISAELKIIIAAVTVRPVAGIILTISSEQQGEESMAKKAAVGATADIQILDDGSGNALAVVTFVDDVGNPTTAPAGSTVTTVPTLSDPAISASVDLSGLNISLSPTPTPAGTPPALVSGVSLSVSVTITPASGPALGPFTATGATLLDVVAGGPAGVQLTES